MAIMHGSFESLRCFMHISTAEESTHTYKIIKSGAHSYSHTSKLLHRPPPPPCWLTWCHVWVSDVSGLWDGWAEALMFVWTFSSGWQSVITLSSLWDHGQAHPRWHQAKGPEIHIISFPSKRCCLSLSQVPEKPLQCFKQMSGDQNFKRG